MCRLMEVRPLDILREWMRRRHQVDPLPEIKWNEEQLYYECGSKVSHGKKQYKKQSQTSE